MLSYRPLKIYSLIYFKAWLLDKTWQIVAVSIAAQIGTAPIAVLYFNSLPVYFCLTNIFVIPLVFVCMYSALGLIVFSKVDAIADIIAIVLQAFLKIMNWGIDFISRLPGALLGDLYIPGIGVVGIYSMLILFSIYLFSKRLMYAKLTMLILILFLGGNIYRNYILSENREIIIYDIPKHSTLEFIKGKESRFYLYGKEIEQYEKKIGFNCYKNWIVKRLKYQDQAIQTYRKNNQFKFNDLIIRRSGNVLMFEGYLIYLHLDNNYLTKKSLMRLKVNDILVTGNSSGNIKDLIEKFDFNRIILDSSLNKYQLKKWEEDCLVNNVDYYSVSDQGALIIDLNILKAV